MRLYLTERATQWGFSLYELEVYGNPTGPTATPNPSNRAPAAPVITEPGFDGKVANPGDVHMETGFMADPDAGASLSDTYIGYGFLTAGATVDPGQARKVADEAASDIVTNLPAAMQDVAFYAPPDPHADVTDPKALAAQPRRLKVVKLQRSMTLEEIAKAYPSTVPIEKSDCTMTPESRCMVTAASSCSVFREEGEVQARTFLAHNSDALSLAAPGHLLPADGSQPEAVRDNVSGDHDGFYYALLCKQVPQRVS